MRVHIPVRVRMCVLFGAQCHRRKMCDIHVKLGDVCVGLRDKHSKYTFYCQDNLNASF